MRSITFQHTATQHAATQVAPSGPDAETICGQLDDELVRALGLLHKAPRGILVLTIASLDYGDRATLVAYRLITSEKRKDDTLDVTITPLGKDVIKLCSENLPTLEGSELTSAIEEAEDLLSLAKESSVRTARA